MGGKRKFLKYSQDFYEQNETSKIDSDLEIAIKKSSMSEEHKTQLLQLHKSFLDLKECMAISSKKTRNLLGNMDAAAMDDRISNTIRQISQDKMVLHNVRYIDELEELIELAEKSFEHQKEAKNEEGSDEFSVQFEEKIRDIIFEHKKKQEYIDAKQKVYADTPEEKKAPKDENENIKKLAQILFDLAYYKPEYYNFVVHKSGSNELNFAQIEFYINTIIKPNELNPDQFIIGLDKELNENIPGHKKKYLNTLYNENDEEKLDRLFHEYCQQYPYVLKTESEFENDTEFAATEKVIQPKRDDLNRVIYQYFDIVTIEPNSSPVISKVVEIKERVNYGVADLKGKATQGVAEVKLIAGQVADGVVKVAEGGVELVQDVVKAVTHPRESVETLLARLSTLSKSLNDKKKKIDEEQTSEEKEVPAVPAEKKKRTSDQMDFDKLGQNFLKKDTDIKPHLVIQKNRDKLLKSRKKELNTLQRNFENLDQRIKALEAKMGLNSIFVENLVKPVAGMRKKYKEFKEELKNKLLESNRLEKFDSQIKASIDNNKKMETILAELLVYKEVYEELKTKTLGKNEIKDRLQYIKKHNKEYWKKIMHVNFAYEGKLISEFGDEFKTFYNDHEAYLNLAIATPSNLNQFLSAAIATGAGIAVGTGLAALTTLASFNPFPLATGVAGGILGGAIGLSIYKLWKQDQVGNDEELQKKFKKEMHEAGFNKKAFQTLNIEMSKSIVHMVHLLEGKKHHGINLRKEFIEAHADKLGSKSKEEIDAYIISCSMAELNNFIHTSFDSIYNIHDKDVTTDGNSVRQFINKLFTSEKYYKERMLFSTQLQFTFLEGGRDLVQAYIDAPASKTKIKKASLIALGLAFTGGAIAFGILLGFGYSLLFILPLAACCIFAFLTFKAITHFIYRFDQRTREHLGTVVKQFDSENKRMKGSARTVVEVGVAQLKNLKNVLGEIDQGLIKRLSNMYKHKTFNEQKIFAGSANALIRLLSEGYRHSKFIEIDFTKELKAMIEVAAEQTEFLQRELASGMLLPLPEGKTRTDIKRYGELGQFIKSTTLFLDDEDNPDIKAFGLKKKIKEQLLEIVSVISWSESTKELPPDLVTLYTKKLGGSEQDLVMIRKLHSLEQVHTGSAGLGELIDRHAEVILAGNNSYRKIVGESSWGETENGLNRDDAELTENNIDDCLSNSLIFLLSLDNRNVNQGLTSEYQHNEKYIIYRTLLIKQLAELTDDAHPKYNPALKAKIHKFARNYLHFTDPETVFREIQHQGYVTEYSTSGHKVQNKKGIVDAILVGLTYDTEKITPKTLIEQNIGKINDEQVLFGWQAEALKNIGFYDTRQFLSNVQKAIKNSENLLSRIVNNQNLNTFNVPRIYINAALVQVNKLIEDLGKKGGNYAQAKTALKIHQFRLTNYLLIINSIDGETAPSVPPLLLASQGVEAKSIHEVKASAEAQPELKKLEFKSEPIPRRRAGGISGRMFAEEVRALTPEQECKLVENVAKALTGKQGTVLDFNLNELTGEGLCKQGLLKLLAPRLAEKHHSLLAQNKVSIPKLEAPAAGPIAPLAPG